MSSAFRPSHHLAFVALSLFGAASLTAACGPGGDDGPGGNGDECASALLAGDLVITEVMANPDGDDNGNEFIEIYNASNDTIDLKGLVIEVSKVDGSDVESHAMSQTIIEPGQYLAMGDVLPEFRAAYLGYGYADELGSLNNSGGIINLKCDSVEVDTLTYGEAASGQSQGLDGNITPDHLSNDNLENFCNATTEYATGAFGSPGAANEPCSIVAQTTCLDGGVERDVVQPTVGQLVISEFMPNPDGEVTDATGEWFEVIATGSFDLNGLVAGKDPADPKLNIIDEDCLPVNDGDVILFARSSDPLVNGGLPTPDFTFAFGLTNGSDTLFVGTPDEVVDTVTWTSSSAGASTSLDPGSIDATANDDEANFCTAQLGYGDQGQRGTPGQQNPLCDTSGMCMDGDTLRPTVPPVDGDVKITEWMANPDGGGTVSDTDGEWFEIRFAADADLNGLQLGKAFEPELNVQETLGGIECIKVTAGTHVVFARNTDVNANGGLPADAIDTNISLNNSNSGLFVAFDNVLLDSVSYAATSQGASTQIDDLDQTCDGVTPYGTAGDLGTPGVTNPPCL